MTLVDRWRVLLLPGRELIGLCTGTHHASTQWASALRPDVIDSHVGSDSISVVSWTDPGERVCVGDAGALVAVLGEATDGVASEPA